MAGVLAAVTVAGVYDAWAVLTGHDTICAALRRHRARSNLGLALLALHLARSPRGQ